MTHRSIRHSIIAAACLCTVAGCGDGTAPTPAPELLTSLPRALTDGEQSIISANNAVTLALFQKASAAEPAKNVFLSPLSASLALGMTMNGARNETLDGMRTALQYGAMPQADINAGYKSLIALLMGLDPSVETRIANSIWYRNTLPIDPAFVAAGKDYFDAEVAPLDFTKVDASVKTVNDWVSDKTAARIPSILETITSDDAMFLVNAIYFKGSWRRGFDRSETQAATFTAGDGSARPVPMMHLEAETHVFRGDTWIDGTKMVELPYGNAAFNMEVYLPPDTSTVESWVTRLTVDAIGHRAEWPKTFLSIDEEGTDAAAVTKVGVIFVSAPGPLSMRVDRPYVVLIRERLSGTILFIGKVNVI
jgi:serine protease inhibitor